jgi:hypothetical protein
MLRSRRSPLASADFLFDGLNEQKRRSTSKSFTLIQAGLLLSAER